MQDLYNQQYYVLKPTLIKRLIEPTLDLLGAPTPKGS